MFNHIEEYSEFFINDVPLMDVRAPVEYKQGSFPNAVNLPILDDQQREIVGTCYKKLGKELIKNGKKIPAIVTNQVSITPLHKTSVCALFSSIIIRL